MEYFNASDDIAFGSQPEPADLKALAARGVKTIINTRFPEEDQGDLPPERARAQAESLGMRYVNVPVSPVEFSPASLAEVSRALDEARAHGPTFVHWKATGRAGICSLNHLADENDWTAREMEGAADATGFDWREAPLAPKYREFFARRPGGS